MLNRILAKAIMGGKGFEILESMLDRAQGKAKQTTDNNFNIGGIKTITIEPV